MWSLYHVKLLKLYSNQTLLACIHWGRKTMLKRLCIFDFCGILSQDLFLFLFCFFARSKPLPVASTTQLSHTPVWIPPYHSTSVLLRLNAFQDLMCLRAFLPFPCDTPTPTESPLPPQRRCRWCWSRAAWRLLSSSPLSPPPCSCATSDLRQPKVSTYRPLL